ncbi:unnamed protein product [Musa textilis]
MLRLTHRRRTVTAPGISLLLLFLLRRRTIPSPPSSPVRRSHPSSLFPLSSKISRFPDTILLLPSPPSSLFHPFIAAPAPCRPRQPPRPSPDSDPNGPLSIFLLRTRLPPSHSYTPLFALSIHLPLPFPNP